jgi:hypothetical protein
MSSPSKKSISGAELYVLAVTIDDSEEMWVVVNAANGVGFSRVTSTKRGTRSTVETAREFVEALALL